MDVANRDKLKPIFRDVTELTAHHSLTEKIREAVKSSRFLIVVCSPAAKDSHWVNEEIKLFRSLHGEGAILSVIAGGEPDTAFPPALIQDGREPLAANMTSQEGFHFGISQLAASMLGVELDRLLQRDSRRRRNRLRIMMAGSLTFAAVMGGMAWTAMDARDEAETSRTEAEKMVEYLITDLKEELDAVGRLSILDDVGIRVTEYYDAIPISDMDDDRLARQARARHVLGEVAIKQGRLDHALIVLTAAYNATAEYLDRKPDDPKAIFAHAQSEYWVGKIFLEQKEPEKAVGYRQAYRELAKTLYEIDPNNRDYRLEYGWAENNLGYLFRNMGNFDQAVTHYRFAINIFENLKLDHPDDRSIVFELASTRRNLASSEFKMGHNEAAKTNLQKAIQSLSKLRAHAPDNKKYLYTLTSAKLWLQEIFIAGGECRVPEIHDTFKGIKKLIERDSTRSQWNRDYLRLVRVVSEHCPSHFENQWLNLEIDDAFEAFDRIEHKNGLVLENRTWLESFKLELQSSYSTQRSSLVED